LAASPTQARTNSNQASSNNARTDVQARVEFIAVTQSDELLEQLGQALDGESAIRHADTVAAARDLIEAAQPCVVMLDAREHTNPAHALDELQSGSGLSVIVVFAPAAQTTTVAQSIKSSAAFAVLPIPLETAKTAAVLEGARDEAMARRNVVGGAPQGGPQSHAPHATSAPLSSEYMTAPRLAYPPAATAAHPPPSRSSVAARRGPPRVAILGGLVAVVLVAAAAAWFVLRGGRDAAVVVTDETPASPEPATEPAAGPTPAEAPAPTAIDRRPPPAVATRAPSSAEAVVPGAVDELLDKARLAFGDRRYTDPEKDNALLYYRSVLAQDPGNGEALEGLARIGGVLDGRLQTAISQREFDDAAVTLAYLKLIKPGDAGLKATEGKLAEARIAAALEDDEVDRAAALLRQASQSGALPAERTARLRDDIERRQGDDRAQRLAELVSARIREGKLVEPANDSARFHLTQLRKAAPDSRRATNAERELQNALLQRAREAGVARQNAEMDRWLAEARGSGVSPARITAVQREVRAALAAKSPAVTDAERNAKLVQERINDGRLLDPAQDSAMFHLSALRATDPAAAGAAATALSGALLERGRGSLAGGRLDEAQRFADAARQLGVNLSDVEALVAGIAGARGPEIASPVRVTADQIKRTRYVAPEYPRQALANEMSGNVKVTYTVGTDGRVRDAAITASTPPGVFDEAALAAVRRWRFRPFEVDGTPVEAISATVLIFKPDVTQDR
jgi:protein TonB